jgi:stalled ribosome rescue protein Dom34
MNGKKPLHLAVWLDHRTARLLTLSRQGTAEQIIHNEDAGADGNVHHHSGTVGSGHAAMNSDFLERISHAIGQADEILILGPVEARNALKDFLERHAQLQASRIVGVEAVDHSGVAEIAAFAQRFFNRVGRMGLPN